MKRLVCGLFFASTLAAQQRCAIRGSVKDGLTNEPLARARVFAQMVSTSTGEQPLPVRQVTDADGAFCFETLNPGSYQLRASRVFYVDASYGEHWPGGRGQKLEIASGTTAPPIVIKMMPQAIIEGTLVDADGDPLQGARIELVKAHWEKAKRMTAPVDQTTTDEEGRYRFGQLAAGTYFISATPGLAHKMEGLPKREMFDQSRQPFKNVLGRTYYKDAIAFRDATPIRLRSGQDVDNLDLTLQTAEARHVSGRVAPEISEQNQQRLYFLQEETGSPGVWFSVPVRKDGSFTADGVFPDYYFLYIGGATAHIDLTKGDIDGLTLEPNSAIELQISLHYDSKQPVQIRSLALMNRTANSMQRDQPIEAKYLSDEKFEMAAAPGQYEIGGLGDGVPYFIQDLLMDGERQPAGVLNLEGKGRKSIELFLSSKPASIEGTLSGTYSRENPATILMKRDGDPETNEKRIESADGRFQWTLTQGGRYRLYAFEDLDDDAWSNPELQSLLESKSAVVDVNEGEHLKVNLPLITADEFAGAVRKTGY